MHLYELTTTYAAVLDRAYDLAEDGEIPAGIVAELDALEGDIDTKLSGCCRMVKALSAMAHANAEEAKRLTQRAKAAEHGVSQIKDYMQHNMESMGWDKRKVDELFTVALQNSPPSVVVEDLDAVPVEFDRVQERVIDKTAIKAAIQAGKEVPGCSLIQTKHLRIR